MAQEMSSYLKKLTWDPRLKQGIVAGLLTNLRFTLLLIFTIIIGGVFSLVNLPRRINPQVNIPIVFITTVLPGASSTDVEKLVTDQLETSIRSVPGISRFNSTSQDNVSTIAIEFESNVEPDKARNDVQAAVDTVATLPQDAIPPKVIRLDFEDIPVITFAITTTSDDISLMDFARNLKKDLENVAQIENAVISGFETSEIVVEMDPQALQNYSLNPVSVSQAISDALTTIPSGIVQTDRATVSVAVETGTDKLELLRKLPLTIQNQTVTLGQIAGIMIKSQPNQPASYVATNDIEPLRAVTFSVFKTAGSDLESSAQEAKQVVAKAIDRSAGRFTLYPITDFDEQIDNQFQDLLADFLTSILLVFLTLLIFLGIRQATISSFVIPLSFFATFAVMYLVDIELSFLSIFSLLLGLGMIVDDTIVMVSAMTDYYATKKFTPTQTGLLVYKDFLGPTLSSNLTNIWSFLPLLIASGIIGEFTKVISIVVTVALIGSTIIALIVTIPLMIAVLKPPRLPEVLTGAKAALVIITLGLFALFFRTNPYLPVILTVFALFLYIARLTLNPVRQQIARSTTSIWFNKINLSRSLYTGFIDAKAPIAKYKQVLIQILGSKKAKRHTLIAVVSFAIFAYTLVPLGFVKNEFFPKTNEDIVYLTVTLPAGTPLTVTQEEGVRLLQEIRNLEGLEYALLDIGVGVDVSTVNISQINANLIRISARLAKDRSQTSMAIANHLREVYSHYPKGDLKIVEVSGGPPTGADIQLTVTGDNLRTLEQYANQAKIHLESIPGTTNVELSIKPSTPRIVFQPNIIRANQEGVSFRQIGGLIRQYTSGTKLTDLIIDNSECETACPVMLRLDENIFEAASLPSLTITKPNGQSLPITALGDFTLQANPAAITHRDGTRSLSVRASVLSGFNQVEIGNTALEYVQTEMRLEPGYAWLSGGINEENSRSVQSIIQAMGLAAMLILATMVIELRSFKRAFIVMLAIPLAISGVFIMFALTNTPLSFPALIGVLALFGIVVKNSILIVDKINRNLEIGLPFTESVADGASSRLEPIAFSSLTNIIGLLPITLSDPLWRGLGGAIISGLTLSGLIMLIFIPVIFDVWYRPRYSK
jgi:multidrug efflux pump subunit AcrB